jgi:acetyl esterase/lipase
LPGAQSNLADAHSYREAYLPSTTEDDRRDPDISPFYADLKKLKCPPAIFTCGTLDPLLDDSVLMATKWTMSGAEAVIKLYPGTSRVELQPIDAMYYPVG